MNSPPPCNPQPQIVYVNAPPQNPNMATNVVNTNVVVKNNTGGVNHCAYGTCCLLTGGLWAPCWIGAIFGCCGPRPCG